MGNLGGRSPQRVEVRLPHEPAAAERGRSVVRERLEGLLPPHRVEDAVLMADELVANAVRHAQPEPSGTIGVRIDVLHDRVRVVVTDGSPSFEWSTRASTELAHGFGLVLVDRIASRWGMSLDGKKGVWFEVDLPGELPDD